MKGLVLAVVMIVASIVAITLIFRSRMIRARAALIMRTFLVGLTVLVTVHRATPPDLWMLPPALVEPVWPIDLALGLVVYTALFLGGLLQVYAQADRGFSVRILIDIADAEPLGLTVSDVMARYSGGKGIGWLSERRIDAMMQQALIRVVGDDFVCPPRGILITAVCGRLRNWLRLPPP